MRQKGTYLVTKVAMVTEGTADSLLYINANCGKWDVCASEAIIKSMGGYYTDQRGQPIIYDPEKSYVNDVGTITTMDE